MPAPEVRPRCAALVCHELWHDVLPAAVHSLHRVPKGQPFGVVVFDEICGALPCALQAPGFCAPSKIRAAQFLENDTKKRVCRVVLDKGIGPLGVQFSRALGMTHWPGLSAKCAEEVHPDRFARDAIKLLEMLVHSRQRP